MIGILLQLMLLMLLIHCYMAKLLLYCLCFWSLWLLLLLLCIELYTYVYCCTCIYRKSMHIFVYIGIFMYICMSNKQSIPLCCCVVLQSRCDWRGDLATLHALHACRMCEIDWHPQHVGFMHGAVCFCNNSARSGSRVVRKGLLYIPIYIYVYRHIYI